MLSRTRLYAMAGLTVLMAYGPLSAALFNRGAPTPAAQPAASAAPTDVKDEIDIKKLSEAFGHVLGKNLKSSGLNFDLDAFIKGIQDGVAGKPAPLTDKEYEKGMLALQQKAIKKLSEDNLKAANDYLQENASKSGVIVLEPGKLQYQIIEQGKGDAVPEHGTPSIQYKGSYIDGTVFGNSQESGGPVTLPLDQTIPGFSKAIVGMKEGEKRRIFVHPDMGYGTTGHLPPNSLLIFDVEVVKAVSPHLDANSDDEDDEDNESKPLAEADDVKKTASGKKSDKRDSDDDIDDQDDDDYDDDDDLEDQARDTRTNTTVKPSTK